MTDGAKRDAWKGMRVYTIGHSTRTVDELAGALRSFDVRVLVDIRTVPRSRHNPQFNGDSLANALARHDLEYVHLPRLGGLRRPRKDSPNGAWRNLSFRGYADYMLTPDFETGLHELAEQTSRGTPAIMCAEAVQWRCHRSLVADALVVRGAAVEHISAPGRSTAHVLTSFAEVRGTRITYPPSEPMLPSL
jgi:uncharacterized protein (DUF488 family)